MKNKQSNYNVSVYLLIINRFFYANVFVIFYLAS